jgi:hypothetical protein
MSIASAVNYSLFSDNLSAGGVISPFHGTNMRNNGDNHAGSLPTRSAYQSSV